MEEEEADPYIWVSRNPAVKHLIDNLRGKHVARQTFSRIADRVCLLLAEEALALPITHPIITPDTKISTASIDTTHKRERDNDDFTRNTQKQLHNRVLISTGTGSQLEIAGNEIDAEDICVISIMRSGDVLMEAVRKICSCMAGKLLIQRDESTKEKTAKLFYAKLPPMLISNPERFKYVLLVDPMLGTGGSSCLAIKYLVDTCKIDSSKIMFLSIISCPEGIKAVRKLHPKVRLITGIVDDYLNDDKYIVPGLGDFGDRYYGTNHVQE